MIKPLLLLLLFAVAGFLSSAESQPVEVPSDMLQRLSAFIDAAPSVIAEKKVPDVKVTWHVDEAGPDFYVIGVGDDYPDQWVRKLTLKIYTDGTLCRQGYDQDKEMVWILDYKSVAQEAKVPEKEKPITPKAQPAK